MQALVATSSARRFLPWILAAALLAGCQPESGSVRDAPEADTPLLLISIDGFRHDYFEHFDSPAMDRLMARGLRADSLMHAFPTKTFATHYTLVTGLHPGTHGVVANNMWDPKRDATFSLRDREAVSDGFWYDGGEPIWVTAEQQGLIAATFFWPGSEARIRRVRPTYWKPYDGSVTHTERIEQVLEWLDLPAEARPDFLTLYFSAVDSRGHGAGPAAPATLDAAADVDRHLGMLLDGLEAHGRLDDINILIVSDHGMTATDRERYIMLDELIELDGLHISDWGPAAQIWTGERDPEAVVAALEGAHPHLRAWKREDIPDRYRFGSHYRVPDVLVEADPGWMISAAPFLANEWTPPKGMHGWDPAWGEMHGILIAAGPDFRDGSRSPAMRSVDLYALMTHLLDLEPAPNEGSLNAFRPYLSEADIPEPAYRRIAFDCDAGPVEARIGPEHMALHVDGYIFVLDRVGDRRFREVGVKFWMDGDQAGGRYDDKPLGQCRQIN